MIDEYTLEEARLAIAEVCHDILSSHPRNPASNELADFYHPSVTKIQGEHDLSLTLSYGHYIDPKERQCPENIAGVKLIVKNLGQKEIELDYPLNTDFLEFVTLRFSDFRPGGKVVSRYMDPNKPPRGITTEQHRLLWRGYRTLAANILDWNQPRIIFPENLT